MAVRSNPKIISTLLFLCAGCTAITGATDYKVDPSLDDDDAGNAQMAEMRDLRFTLKGMYPHANVPVDIAVVSESNVLQARARVIMPPSPEDVTKYPDVEVNLRNGLPPGKQTLFMFADQNGNGVVDFKDNGDMSPPGIIEHVWKIALDPSGIGEFVHVADFQFFDEGDYSSLNGDLIMQLPMLGLGNSEFAKCIEDKLAGDVEIRLTLLSADRQVGLFRRMPLTSLPPDGVHLRGILDGGSNYRIEVLVDGAVKRTLRKTAPANGNLEVPPSEWFPAKLDSMLDCR